MPTERSSKKPGVASDSVSERKRLFDIVRDSADKNRTYFFAWLVAALYVLVTVAGTTDAQLLLPDGGVTLPILGMQLPMFSFYLAVPILVIAIQFNLLQNLDSHAYKLNRWREAWNGTPPRDELQAFLFDFAFLEKGGAFDVPVRIASDLLFYWFGPIVLFTVLVRFSDYQNPIYTSYHFAMLTLGLAIALRARAKLPIGQPFGASRYRLRSVVFPVMTMLAICLLGLPSLLLTWAMTFESSSAHRLMVAVKAWPDTVAVAREVLLPRLVIPAAAKLPGLDSQLDLRARVDGRTLLDWWRLRGRGLDLQGRSLRYATFQGIDLRKADLSSAQLDSADFIHVDLRGVAMSRASVREAYFFRNDMQGADIRYANLRGSRFFGVNLDGADFAQTNLTHAELVTATLIGTNLIQNDVQGMTLREISFLAANRADGAAGLSPHGTEQWKKLEQGIPSHDAIARLNLTRTGILRSFDIDLPSPTTGPADGVPIAFCDTGTLRPATDRRSNESHLQLQCGTVTVRRCRNLDAWQFWLRIPCDSSS